MWIEDQAEVHQLVPVRTQAPTLGRNDDPAREELMRPVFNRPGKPLTPPRWWNNKDFSTWLAGRSVAVSSHDLLRITRRLQVHVGIDPDKLTSNDGVLFSHDVLETLDPSGEWAIGVEVTLPDGGVADVATLGSDSRLSRVESLPSGLFEPPVSVLEAFRATSQGIRIVAITPLFFAKGWVPDGLSESGGEYKGRLPGLNHEVVMRAAFVSRPVHVSGWDMATGTPKPTSRMVPPGAVYFFERADGKPFGEADANSLWLAALGTRTDEGFGRVVPGIWSPARNTT
jgi:CRISPR-associated protein Cmr3